MIQYLLCIISTWFNSDLDSPSLCHPVSVSFENFMRFIWKFHALFIHLLCIISTWFNICYALLVHDSILTWTHQVSVTQSLFHLKISCVSFESFMRYSYMIQFFMHYSYMIQFWLGLTKSLSPSRCFICRFHAWFIHDSILTWTYQVSVSFAGI